MTAILRKTGLRPQLDLLEERNAPGSVLGWWGSDNLLASWDHAPVPASARATTTESLSLAESRLDDTLPVVTLPRAEHVAPATRRVATLGDRLVPFNNAQRKSPLEFSTPGPHLFQNRLESLINRPTGHGLTFAPSIPIAMTLVRGSQGAGFQQVVTSATSTTDVDRAVTSRNSLPGTPTGDSSGSTPAASTPPVDDHALMAQYGKTGLRFEQNVGQTDSRVDFLVRGINHSVYLTGEAAVMVATASDGDGGLRGGVLRMRLVGGTADAQGVGLDRQESVSNYMIGNDESRWHTGVANFGRVLYEDVYAGIDQVFYPTAGGQLEYDFVVAPGADASVIRLAFDGADDLRVDDAGNLVITVGGESLTQLAPVLYQQIHGARQAVEGRYVLENGQVGFALGDYDRSQALVIDPITLSYSTFLGGSGSDTGYDIAVDDDGYAYITGQTASTGFPTTMGAFDTTFNGNDGDPIPTDVFVTKMNASGTALVWSTFVGGTDYDAGPLPEGFDRGLGIAVDAAGHVYVTGATASDDFPVSSTPYQSSLQIATPYLAWQTNAFFFKLTDEGDDLMYSTYIGRTNSGEPSEAYDETGEVGYAVVVDEDEWAYVVGATYGVDALLYNSDPDKFHVTDAWFMVIDTQQYQDSPVTDADRDPLDLYWNINSIRPNPGGDARDGSMGQEEAYDVVLVAHGDFVVCGRTDSTDFYTTADAYQETLALNGGNATYDAFVSRIQYDDPDNDDDIGFVYSTYLGGSGNDSAYSVALDGELSPYVTGFAGTSFPTTSGAFHETDDGGAFVTKLDPDFEDVDYSTYLDDSAFMNPYSTGYAIAVDGEGKAYVAGVTEAFGVTATYGAYQTSHGGFAMEDAFFLILNASGTSQEYCTFLGGTGNDGAYGLAMDDDGDIYLTGYTASAGGGLSVPFPTTGGVYDTSHNGGTNDVFVAKFSI